MKINIYWILLLIVLTVGGLTAQAQDVRFRSRAEIDSLLNPPLQEDAETIIRMDKTVENIGTLTEDDAPFVCKFICTNVSKEAVNLTEVRTTCGCLKADYQEGVLTPGEKREIRLTYYPQNHPGTVDANAFVYLTETGKTPVAKLTLLGNVLPGADEWARYPHVMGHLRLKQQSVEIQFAAGEKATERILCANSGDKPMRLSAQLIPSFACFNTEPAIIQPGSEGDIIITVDKTLLPEDKGEAFSFPIVVGGINGRPSDRTINVKVYVSNTNNK